MGVKSEYTRHSKRVTATRRWQVLRPAILERDGWACVDCGQKRGRLEVDHIKPVRLRPDLAFDPNNCATRCPRCHTRKTRIECGHPAPIQSPARDAWAKAVAELEGKNPKRPSWAIPFDLRPSRIPVTIVCGPPGAGKSTYIRNNAAQGDIVIDFDDFLKSLGGVKWDQDPQKVKAAHKMRDDALRSLNATTRGRAWVPVTAPSGAERSEWKRLLVRAKIIMLAVDADTCKARIRADPYRQHAIEPMCAGVDRWWRIYAENSAIPS